MNMSRILVVMCVVGLISALFSYKAPSGSDQQMVSVVVPGPTSGSHSIDFSKIAIGSKRTWLPINMEFENYPDEIIYKVVEAWEKEWKIDAGMDWRPEYRVIDDGNGRSHFFLYGLWVLSPKRLR